VIVVDTHAHLYPCYDVDRFFAAARRNLSRIASGRDVCARVLCLTERATENAFADLRGERLRPRGWHVVHCPDRTAVRVAAEDGFELMVVAGRQVVTQEGLEVLALGVTVAIPNGLAGRETIDRTRALDGLPVLPWSPGKWIGRRGRLVRALIETAAPGQLLLGDVALRPRPSPEPRLLTLGRRRGFTLLAGSDPLPLAGEERHVGRYATAVDGVVSPATPSAFLRASLCEVGAAPSVCGSRRSWLSVGCALARHALARG
jgi:hypothetical protein